VKYPHYPVFGIFVAHHGCKNETDKMPVNQIHKSTGRPIYEIEDLETISSAFCGQTRIGLFCRWLPTGWGKLVEKVGWWRRIFLL
jgi:hypothetical protein